MNEITIDEKTIQDKIYTIRSFQVMLDRDLGKKVFGFNKIDINLLRIDLNGK